MHTLAKNIISKFGGHYRMAELLEMDPSQIYRWTYSKERGGTDGKIPDRNFPKILKAAQKLNITIALEELIAVPKTKKPRSN